MIGVRLYLQSNLGILLPYLLDNKIAPLYGISI